MKGLVNVFSKITDVLNISKVRNTIEDKIVVSLYATNLILILANVGFVILFLFTHNPTLYLNLFCFLPLFSVFVLLKKRKLNAFLILSFINLLTYLTIVVLLMGWGAGYQVWIFAILCAYYLPFYTIVKNSFNKRLPGFIICIVYFLLYFLSPKLTFMRLDVSLVELKILYIYNALLTAICISGFCYYYSSRSIFNRNKIKERSYHDTLTSLPNRYAIEETINNLIATSTRNKIFVAMTDIDFFKKVNDKYGHLAGDEVLKEFANLLRTLERNGLFVGRWGGEEFIVICSSHTLDEFYKIMDKFRKKIHNHKVKYGNRNIKIAISGGISEYEKGMPIKRLVELADNKLYEAKEAGRNRIVR